MRVRSSLGPQLARLELLSCDSNGKRIPKRDRSANLISIRETRSYYDNPESGGEEIIAIEDGGLRARFESLTSEERRCLQLHEARGRELDALVDPHTLAMLMGSRKGPRVREEHCMVHQHEEENLVAAGWHLVKRDKRMSLLVKNFPIHLGYEQIAHITGLTPKQVRGRVLSAHSKLRAG